MGRVIIELSPAGAEAGTELGKRIIELFWSPYAQIKSWGCNRSKLRLSRANVKIVRLMASKNDESGEHEETGKAHSKELGFWLPSV